MTHSTLPVRTLGEEAAAHLIRIFQETGDETPER